MASTTRASIRPPRRWRVPAALRCDPDAPETLEGERILAEYPDDRGMLLWQGYRDGVLWAHTPPEKRRALFQAGCPERRRELLAATRVDAAMLRALETLHAGVRSGRSDGGMVSRAALSIAAAAERDQAPATAISFAQLGSMLDPAAPSPALAVGRIALGFGHHAVAETWLRRTIGLARRDRDWAMYGGALVWLARLRERTDQPAAADAEYHRALSLSRRWSLSETRRQAFHGLLRMAIRSGDYASAVEYARGARRCYGREHPDLGSLELDVAELELRLGNRARAAELLEAALPSRESTHEQIRALTMLVRAAPDPSAAEDAWHRASELIELYGSSLEAALALLELARAAAEIHHEKHADLAAARALAYARQLGCDALVQAISAFLARPRLARPTEGPADTALS